MDNDILAWLRQRLNFSLRRRVPLILQTEATECGLACLAMISSWHGRHTDILSLRSEFGISSRGATLSTISTIAAGNGLASRALSLELDELEELQLPCILHWDFSHFVVLVQVSADRCIIHDPALGRRSVTRKEISEHFTGVALELWPDTGFVPETTRRQLRLRELIRSIGGFRRALLKVFCFSLMTEFISLLLPVGTQLAMDHVIPAADLGLLKLICLALFGLIILQAALGLIRAWSMMITDTLTDIQWKDGLFRHLLRLPLPWFEKRRMGDIQSRFSSLDMLRSTFIHDINGSVVDSIMMLGALTLLCAYGGYLAAIVVGFTVLYVVLRLATFPRYRQLAEEQIIKSATAGSHFMETLYGIATLRAQGLAPQRRRNWLTLQVNAANASVNQQRFDMSFTAVSVFTGACDNVLILWLGISAIIGHEMTIGAFVAFSTFRELFASRALSLTDMLLRMRMLSLHNERISDIALTEPEPDVAEKELFIRGKALTLETHTLNFRYDSQSPAVFSNLNLYFKAGESVAIIGPSGCGKSTLMKVLCGLTKPESGKVLVDGRDIHAAGVNNYRRSVACILQEDRLFAGSLRENITAFTEEVDDDWLESCARLSHIHDDIMALPMGYETLTGELGEGLSGGQRQRIFIARALYRRPGILFMDEATSHLDEKNEALINQAIAGLDITRIIIAHRHSTIASAQRVINLSQVTEVQLS